MKKNNKNFLLFCAAIVLILIIISFGGAIIYVQCMSPVEIPRQKSLCYEISGINRNPKWKVFWDNLLAYCTKPNAKLIQHDDLEKHSLVYEQCLHYPEKKKWTSFEIESHMPNNRLVGRGPQAENGWIQNNGKFKNNSVQQMSSLVGHLTNILRADAREFRPSGYLYYPSGGYKEWHTNRFEAPGWRIYFIHTEHDGCSDFKYIDPHTDRVVNRKDRDGIARLFRITDGKHAGEPLLWHSIHSQGDRWSFGFHVSDRVAEYFMKFCEQGDVM